MGDGDDGTIRGIDIVEDQVIVELKDGHQGKIKILLLLLTRIQWRS